MRTETQLDIVWEGSVRGLTQHRVSLTEFGPAMTQLLVATRRITSQILLNAHEATEVGRLANAAKHMDIELVSVKEGSSGFESVLAFETPDNQDLLFGRLVEDVGSELMEAVRLESEGVYRNSAVRKYLALLPKGLEHQSYRLHDNGREIKRVEVGAMRLPAIPIPSAALLQATGNVVGVGFEPGKPEVRIKGEGVTFTATASERQIEKALKSRGQEVSALAVASEAGSRLIALKTADEREARRGKAAAAVFSKWQGAFKALA